MSRIDLKPVENDSELENVLNQSFNKLLSMKFEDISRKCDVVYLKPRNGPGMGRFIVNLLNKTYTVELDKKGVFDVISGKKASNKLSYVMVEYLINGDGSPIGSSWIPTTKAITNQEILNYFKKYVIRPLTQLFGYDVEKFEKASRMIGGKREELGGVSFSYLFLPKVKFLFQIWAGDRRSFTQPAINISTSNTAKNYLPALPLVYACESIVNFLEKEATSPERGRRRRV